MEIAEEAKRLAQAELGKHPGDRPRTGKMALSYRVMVIPGTNQFRVDNRQEYAAAIELGAQPHEIRARRVEYLQFRGRDGRMRRVKMVHHPGNKENLLMSRAADTAVQRRIGTVRHG